MSKFAQLGADIARLWTKYGGAYVSGMRNTLLLGVDLGMTLGPMIGGAVLDVAGPTALYLFATCVGVCLCLWTIPYIRLTRKRAVEANESSAD